MNLLRYWRNSLADADMLNPAFDKRKANGLLINWEQIIEGKLSVETIKQFIKLSNDDNKVYDVLLCPKVMYLKRLHGSTLLSKLQDSMVPLWIPALVTRNGILKPHLRYSPWINREYLEPCESVVEPIASVSDVDNFLSRNATVFEQWSDYIAFALRMFEQVVGISLNEFEHPQYGTSNECYILQGDLIKGSSKNVQDLYHCILRDYPDIKELPLLNRIVGSLDTKNEPISVSLTEYRDIAINHLGQMSNEFSLSSSQRIAMHHSSLLDNGELLAINGPPGTGKTTLLQSVVATSVIERALEETDPPIIVVSSTNNNAVTNVIDSFGKIKEIADHPLQGRWISDVYSYGAHLKSSLNHQESHNIRLSVYKDNQGGHGFFERMEDYEYIEQCKREYLHYFAKFSNEPISDVQHAVKYLHHELQAKVKSLQEIIHTIEECKALEAKLNQTYPSGVEETVEHLEQEINLSKNQYAHNEEILKKWNHWKLNEKWWVSLLGELPIFKVIAAQKREYRYQIFCIDHGLSITLSENAWLQKLHLEQNRLIIEIEDSKQKFTQLKQELAYLQSLQKQQELYLCQLSLNDRSDYLDRLDCTLRYEAFKLAIHYWEGRWILETESMLSDSNYKRNNGVQGVELLWKRLAKLTPCFVSTFYMLPHFFSGYRGKTIPLYNFIDILIIDEAGQVIPEIAGASFALAKKSIVVGDTLQIPPVWNIPNTIDIANARHFGITSSPEAYESLSSLGIFAADGSVMRVAQQLSKFVEEKSEGNNEDSNPKHSFKNMLSRDGLWLTEHRRCVPEIIGYCNEIAYKGKLEAKRPSIRNYFLPHMGYAHIPGIAEKRGGSLKNDLEAETIISWIDKNKKEILNYYKKDGFTSIDDIVAVVTPFAAQKRVLRSKMNRAGMNNMKAGTVHTLQGDERPIIIFSPVYDSLSADKYYYDQDVSMLNVAVSRAKDSFLVFGDMSIFKPTSSNYSGKLAKYLFQSEENEIKNINLENYYATKYGVPIEQLYDLEQHRSILKNCIVSAQYEVHIISPYLSFEAIKADNLMFIFDEAIKRGIKVYVYTDESLNSTNNKLNWNYAQAKNNLKALGVSIQLVERVHSKALWIDSSLLIHGSFNWLSAIRKSEHLWCRYETSLVYRGSRLNEMINQLKKDLKERKVLI